MRNPTKQIIKQKQAEAIPYIYGGAAGDGEQHAAFPYVQYDDYDDGDCFGDAMASGKRIDVSTTSSPIMAYGSTLPR